MTTINISDKQIKVYTNKNGFIFRKASELAYKEIPVGQYGIIYDDFNPDMKKVNEWKNINLSIRVGKNNCYKKSNVVILPSQSSN